ncbi:hypothetical protein FPCIR_10897 [Fusarium pseudocircinatum]|uniref:Uncharacterized protein n=1 Tax=Fusarium pseudocircinatum TaxID=56676 RepID=A0A8H5NV47_9HYPO|nr:hypothetical protein FPCIR_10897 [Fusarium pseudocircinatum]
MSDIASQVRIQDSKQKLQQAYKYAASAKESAESDFQQAQDDGIADGQDFRQWAVVNAPAYSAALQDYKAAAAGYSAALKSGDNEASQAWDQKYKEAILGDNPARPNYEALVEP